MQYYYSTDGSNQHGPASLEELAQAQLAPNTLVWRDGLAAWTPASELPELASLFSAPQPAAQSWPQQQAQAASQQWTQPTALARTQPAPQHAPGGYVPYHTPQAISAPANGLAIASMVLGIVSLLILCFYGLGVVTAVLAIIFGHMAKGQIARGEGQGTGMAVAGLVMGYIVVGLVLLGIVAIIIIVAASSQY